MTKDRAAKNGYEDLTTLERVLQLHGQFRRSLEPLRVTPLQAGVLLFLRRHPEAKVTDAADALVVRVPTVSEVVSDLVRKRWVSKRRSPQDDRVVLLSLSRQGQTLVQRVSAALGN
jgi:DNA-binding MarR family transcriptional regulator